MALEPNQFWAARMMDCGDVSTWIFVGDSHMIHGVLDRGGGGETGEGLRMMVV